MHSQCRLNSPTSLNSASGQSRHLILRTAPRAQSACTATSSARYPVLRSFGIFEAFLLHFILLLLLRLHCALSAVRHFLHTPLYPDQLSVRSFFRPPLLETWPQQGSMVKSVRIRGREPLRSASCLLGSTIDTCFWDPGNRLVADPRCGPRCLQDPIWLVAPDSFLGRHPVAIDYHRGPVAMRLIAAAFCWGSCGCGYRWRSRDGPGYFVGSQPRWISASIGLARLDKLPLFTGGRTEKRYSRRGARDIRAEFWPNQAPFAPTSEGGRCRVVDGLPWPGKARIAHLDCRVVSRSYWGSQPAKEL